MVWLPTLSAESGGDVATPLGLSVAADPNGVPSTANCTLPVGVAPPGGDEATVAVQVTACPKTDGLGDEPSVAVLADPTFWISGFGVAVLAVEVGSPDENAVTFCVLSAA